MSTTQLKYWTCQCGNRFEDGLEGECINGCPRCPKCWTALGGVPTVSLDDWTQPAVPCPECPGAVGAQQFATLRAKLDEVTAQRDELREAGRDAIAAMVSVDPMDYSGARRSAIERLRAAVDGAR